MRSRALFLVAACLSSVGASQSILTVAGGRPLGDGQPATSVTTAFPAGVAVDAAGNLYFAQPTRHRIRKVDAKTGLISTLAGGGSYSGDGMPGTETELKIPRAVAVDAAGNVAFTEENEDRVRRVDAVTGIVTTIAGTGSRGGALGDGGPATSALLCGSLALAFDKAGNLFVAERDGQRVRKVSASTGVITTVAGSTAATCPGAIGPSGDGGPATQALLRFPEGVAVDAAGNIYLSGDDRIRKITAATGIITTVAGGGSLTADGVPATQAQLNGATAIAVDAAGNVYVRANPVFYAKVRKLDVASGLLFTAAGGGTSLLDGIPATSAALGVAGLAFDSGGNLFVSDDVTSRIRKVTNGTITTVAGGGPIGDGGPATSAELLSPWGLAFDGEGNLFIADRAAFRVRKVTASGTITTVAGTGASGALGDGGPAASASLVAPDVVATDAAGNIYIGDEAPVRVRRVDKATGVIGTVAGNGSFGSSGDGGPATNASFMLLRGMAVDAAGNIYLADAFANRIRKVTNGTITTFAGNGTHGFSGDGGPATSAQIAYPQGLAVDTEGNLYIADADNNRIRKVAAGTGIITTVAGNGSSSLSGTPAAGARAVAVDTKGVLFVVDIFGRVSKVDLSTGASSFLIGTDGVPEARSYGGDDGPASLGRLNGPLGAAVDARGGFYVADTGNGRVRAVFPCVTVSAPSLSSPADGATGVSTAPALSWSSVDGAFRYDVLLDTVDPPARVVAADLRTTTFSPANLDAGRKFFWRVVAKGDPFCVPVSTAPSAVRSFTTAAGCDAPAPFSLASPADGASNVASPVSLSWQPAAGAGSYDLYLGASNPPPLFQAGITGTTATASSLVPGTAYRWLVVAHAACDASKTRSTPARTFTLGGGCQAAGAFSLLAPADGAANVPTATTFSWSPSAGASSYDLYLGLSGTAPPLYLTDLTATSATVSGLAPGRSYSWRVVAKVACDATKSATTPLSTFTVAGSCAAPSSTSFTFVPPGNVGKGQTYVVAWKAVAGAGGYIVERATNAAFAPVLDTQATTASFASFVSASPGTYYHRVRAVASCDPTKEGPNSETRSVTVVAGSPSVVFSVQPKAVVTALGEKLEEKKTSLFLENLGASPVQVIVGRQEISSVPFFTVVDPAGGDAAFLSLDPRKPRELEVRFSGPPNDAAGTYQGIVFVAGATQPLAITPYAFVNLKVGGGDATAPFFSKSGTATEYAFFPGLAGDDAGRPPISVDIRNDGATPMELGAEIGPELWLEPEPGWNATAIPPRSSRTVRLFTRRSRAPNASALPRYTYFTVRTKAGASARLLVQDNDAPALAAGRGAPLDPAARSYVVPSVVNATSAIQNTFVSKLRLSNIGSEAVQADLFFTPAGADGFDEAAVKRATVVVPANDVVTLTDPLVQLYGLTPPVAGSLEVRAAPERIGFLNVTSAVDAPAKSGGTFGFQMPTALRGEGARAGSPHVLAGITATPDFRTNLILFETTGRDAASVRATLYDKDGQRKGDMLVNVPRYGQSQISGVVAKLGGSGSFEAGRIELDVESGGGAVGGVVTVIDNTNDDAVTYTSRPATTASASSSVLQRLFPRTNWARAVGTVKLVLPAVVNGFPTFPGSDLPYTFRSLMGFTSGTLAPATFTLTYHDLTSGQTTTKSVTVAARQTREYKNVLEELFGIPAGQGSQGPVFIEADASGIVYAKVYSNLSSGTLGDAFPVFPIPFDALTGASASKPLTVDGLEQSTDPTRGTRSNLILNEVTGQPVTVIVRLYEAGNRSQPMAEKEITLAPLEKRQLSTVFAGMGMDQDDRRKERTNVMCAVVGKSGAGLASAVVTTIDNKTGDTKNSLLTPNGGLPASGGVGF